jgi:hypothetical protein
MTWTRAIHPYRKAKPDHGHAVGHIRAVSSN